MSIGPVGNPLPPPEVQTAERTSWHDPGPNSPSENGPSRESIAVKHAAPVPSVPQDEVKVQWDTPMADYIEIYQFVNQSGSLILQEPNQQMLSLIHDIQQMLQDTEQQAAATSSAPVKPQY